MTGVLSAYFRTSRVQIAALLYFLIAGILTQIPLFNYLGYEFSAFMTIPAALISGVLSILWLNDHRSLPLTRKTWLIVIGDYLLVNAILLLIPFLVISLNAFSVKNCAFAKGALYFLLLPVITMIFSVALSLVIGAVFRRAILCFILVTGALVAHILFITYTQPQLFAYNFILGFFPGITYDETSTDIFSLVLYRQFTVIAALMLLVLFFISIRISSLKDRLTANVSRIRRNFHNDRVLWSIAAFCLIILLAAHIFRDELGFEYSARDIQERLGRRTESAHFIVYYQGEDYTADQMRRLKAEAEFHFHTVSDALKLRETLSKKIEIYIYPNGEWKQRFIGTANTNIAKPWKREIHLTSASFRSTFKHELVHILASEFGAPVINASVRMGMNEGLAVALDWDEGMFTPHQFAAGILRQNGLEHVERLFTLTGFASTSGSFAYLVSGSFIRYLIDRYGIERVRIVFPNGNFMVAFGESLESLIGDWKAFLKTVDASELPRETVVSLFFQQSIFYKTCARTVADQNEKGVAALRAKQFSDAERIFSEAYANAPTAYALRGIFQALNAQQKASEVIKMFSELPEHSSLRNNPGVLLLFGDAYYLTGNVRKASEQYTAVRSMNYSEAFIETSVLRNQYIADSISSSVFHLLYYGGLNDSARSVLIQQEQSKNSRSTALKYYAVLLNNDQSLAADHMLAAARSVPSADLQYFAFVRTAEKLFENNRFEEAKGMYWQAKNIAPTSTVSDQLDGRIELCDFVAVELL